MEATDWPGLSWKLSPPLTGLGNRTGVPVAGGMAVTVRVGLAVVVAVATAVQVEVGIGEAVGVKVGVVVGVRLGVAVACATVTVAPRTGKGLNWTAWPLFPLAPVTLKL